MEVFSFEVEAVSGQRLAYRRAGAGTRLGKADAEVDLAYPVQASSIFGQDRYLLDLGSNGC